jgi:hypothetical protein
MKEGEVGIRNSTDIIVEELGRLTPVQRHCPSLPVVYGHQDMAFMDVGVVAVTQRAAEILRKKAGWTRAEAVEMAFDNLLLADDRYERCGEVALLKGEGVARALCVRKEES